MTKSTDKPQVKPGQDDTVTVTGTDDRGVAAPVLFSITYKSAADAAAARDAILKNAVRVVSHG